MSAATSWQYSRNCLVPDDRTLPEGTSRVAAVIEYDGSAYCGWQRQTHSPGIQSQVERALSRVADEPVEVACAGRTDTGVHATNQVIHFDTRAQRRPDNWLLGANANLPPEIRLHWAGQVPDRFHARFSATARTYRYLISNSPQRPAIFHRWLTWEKRHLDEQGMQRAANLLLGELDFSSFRAAGCQSLTPFRRVDYISLWRRDNLVLLEIRANAFLHHMVRNIAGALIAIGTGDKSFSWLQSLVVARDRTRGTVTAPANGLFLVGVSYPSCFAIPELPPGPALVAEPLRIADR